MDRIASAGREHETLIDAIHFHESDRPDFVVYNEVSSSGDIKQSLTYRELLSRSKSLAANMSQHTRPGDRVLLLLPGGVDFVVAFISCMLAGLVAVPSFPVRAPTSHGSLRNYERIIALLADACPGVILCDAPMIERRAELSEMSSLFANVHWISVAECTRSGEAFVDRASADGIAYLQYTSGSVSTPKGVMISHGNLISTFADLNASCSHDDTSVMISWIPVYHDMGLIYGLLVPLYFGFSVYALLPASVLQQPARWLQSITKFRGTHSAAPNFAYDLCVKKITAEVKRDLDLSSWKVSFNAAEPVRPTTLTLFREAFGECGLNANTVCPGYGLAESTLKVTSIAFGQFAKNIWIDTKFYEQGKVLALNEPLKKSGIRCLQSCGTSHIEADIRIVNTPLLDVCPPDEVGEIWVKSRSVAMGYWNNAEETAITMGAYLRSGDGPFLRTGDVGFFFDGELYVSGRLKDVIIIHGRNVYPQDLELTAELTHPALRAGRCCVFGIETDNGEKIVLVAEIERSVLQHFEAAEVAHQINVAIGSAHELSLADIVFVRSGTFPTTSSGKVQRGLTRVEYCSGKLVTIYSLLRESERPVESSLGTGSVALIRGYIREYLRSCRSVKAGTLDGRCSFNALGLDSIEILELTDWLGTKLGRELPSELLIEYSTIDELSAFLAETP